jgi:serine/threonine protein kinase/tetratricopeptide (TPR) repeat protein
MPPSSSLDAHLLQRLPLPLASLYAHAHNAKTGLERHQAAYYLFEVTLKLLGSAAVLGYAARPARDPRLTERLANLARPSLGHWLEFVRLLVPTLAEAGDPGFVAVRDLAFGRTRDDLPRTAGLDAALAEVLDGKSGPRSTVRPAELFDRLGRYRNKEIGHGAVGRRSGTHYDQMARKLLGGLAELLGRLDPLAGRRLVYVGDVRRRTDGSWLAERYLLAGPVAERLESLELPEAALSDLPHPDRLYLELPAADGAAGRGVLTPLHPLAVYDAESGEVLLLNARRGKARTEYLSYTTGRVVERTDLAGDHRDLLGRLFGLPAGDVPTDAWAARAETEDGAADPAPAPPLAQRSLGDFELLSKLGQGGMGVVYRAWQPSLGRQVALKVLTATGDPKAEARFAREIRALGRVEHPNLIKPFTSGSDGDRWFYAMELVEGPTLAAVIDQLRSAAPNPQSVDGRAWQASVAAASREARRAEQPLSDGAASRPADTPGEAEPAAPAPIPPGRGYVAHVAELVRQVAGAAHALHEAGIIHRDIKPGNVLLTADGRQAVLTDLGLAQLADDVGGRLTKTRQFIGTLRYASPEQLLAVAKLNRRSDVYSLGATLWELLTLRPLFGATDETPTPDLMQRIQFEEPERPRKHHPGLPRDLEAVVLKCLEKNPSRRYPTAHDLALDLGRFLANEPVAAHPPTLRYVLGKSIRRHRGRLAVVAGVLLLAIAGTVAAFVKIDVERRRATESANKAERSFHRSLRAVNKLVDVAEAMKPVIGTKSNTVARILSETEQAYAEVLIDEGQRSDVLNGYARMNVVFSEVYRITGDSRKSLSAATKACETYQQLRALDPAHEWRAGLARAFVESGVTRAYRGDTTGSLKDHQDGLSLREALVRESPENLDWQADLANSQTNLGNVLLARGETARARDLYQAAFTTLERLAKEQPDRPAFLRSLAVAYRRLGWIRSTENDPAGALAAYREAVKLAERLVGLDPGNAEWQMLLTGCRADLGEQHYQSGDAAAAVQELEAARELAQHNVDLDPANAEWQGQLIYARAHLADLKADPRRVREDLGKKVGIWSELLQLSERRVREDPEDALWQQRQAGCHKFLGLLYATLAEAGSDRRPDYGRALQELSLAVEQFRRLAAADPDNRETATSLETTLAQLAEIQRVSGDRQMYRTTLLQSGEVRLRFAERLAGRAPEDPDRKRKVADALQFLALYHNKLGEKSEGLALNLRAAEIQEALVAARPDNTVYLRDLGLTYFYLGIEDPAASLRHRRRAFEVRQKLADRAPDDLSLQEDFLKSAEHLMSGLRTSDQGTNFAWSRGVPLPDPADSAAAQAWELWGQIRPRLVGVLRQKAQRLFETSAPTHADISQSGGSSLARLVAGNRQTKDDVVNGSEDLYRMYLGRADYALVLVWEYLNYAGGLEPRKNPAAADQSRAALRRAVAVCQRLKADRRLQPGEDALITELLAALKRLPPVPAPAQLDGTARQAFEALDFFALANLYADRGKVNELVPLLVEGARTLEHPKLKPDVVPELFRPIAIDLRLGAAVPQAANALRAKDPKALDGPGEGLLRFLESAHSDVAATAAVLRQTLAANPGDRALQERLATWPLNAALDELRVDRLAGLYRYREAAAELNRLIERLGDKASAGHYYRLVALWLAGGQIPPAVEAHRRAAQRFPDAAETLLAEGFIANAERRFDRARELAAKVRAATKATPDQKQTAEVLLALADGETGESGRAEQRVRGLIAAAPENPDYQAMLAFYLLDQGKDPGQAEAAVRAALAAEPNSPTYQSLDGWLRVCGKRDNDGLAVMERLAGHEIIAHDPVFFDHLGDAYLAAGRPGSAREAWQKALGLFPPTTAPDDHRKRAVEAKLQRLPPG